MGTPTDIPLVCYHGSPGSPEDFAALAAALPGSRLIRLVRSGYPAEGYGAADTPIEERLQVDQAVFVGYSWGARCALLAAARSPERVRGLILIAPFLRPSGSMGLLKKVLIQAGPIGTFLIGRAAPKVLEDFLVRTCRPLPVPAEYRERTAHLKHPEVLRRAALEKEEAGPSVEWAIETLRTAKVPALILWAPEDAVGPAAAHVEPLKKGLHAVQEAQFPGAGHALPFTHARQLADSISKFIDDLASKG